MSKYLGLILSFGLLYYFIFKLKLDNQLKKIIVLVAFGTMLASIGGILEDMFPVNRGIIKNIIGIPVAIITLIFFYFLIPMAWKHRNDPDKKVLIYIAFGFMIFTVLVAIAGLILNQFGFFG